MPPRISKRQQRELDELDARAALQSEDIDVFDASRRPQQATLGSSGFAALAPATFNQSPEEPSEEEALPKADGFTKKNRRKKAQRQAGERSVTKPGQSQKETSARPFGLKDRPTAQPKEEDLDLLLEKLAIKNARDIGGPSKPSSTKKRRLWGLISVETNFLDGDEELRRFFGSKVVNSARPTQRKDRMPLRSLLTRPPDDWRGIPMSAGLSMRLLDDHERRRKWAALSDEKWWTFEHSASYKKVEVEFLGAVIQGDPNILAGLLRGHPWHIDTLLQLSEVFRQQEDLSHATDLVDRAIYTFEKAFSPSFNVSSGVHRLDFDFIENRPFFMAIHRQVIQMQRRGCNRAAFEYARLLLTLDPFTDPYGALLHLDYLAPRSGMNKFLLDLWDAWEEVDQDEPLGPDDDGVRINVRCFPGMSYARAAALWNLELETGDKAHDNSTQALRDAILAFPSVLPVLADKAGIHLPENVRTLRSMRVETAWMSNNPGLSAIHLLSHLYASRSTSIWKQPSHVEWVQRTVQTIPLAALQRRDTNVLRENALLHFSLGPSLAICRHVIVSDIRTLLAFINPSVLAQELNAYDPLPPATALSTYNELYFAGVFASRQRSRMQRRDDLEPFAMRHFPRGVLANFDQEQNEANESSDDDEPPVVATDAGEPQSDDQPVEPAAPGFLQTLWNGLWGAPREASDDSDDQ